MNEQARTTMEQQRSNDKEIDLSFRADMERTSTIFDNLVNFQPAYALSLEQDGKLVEFMSSTYLMLRRRAQTFEDAPYELLNQGWSEAMMEYLKNGPQKRIGKALGVKREARMWRIIMGHEISFSWR
jgi:hypothetical protein